MREASPATLPDVVSVGGGAFDRAAWTQVVEFAYTGAVATPFEQVKEFYADRRRRRKDETQRRQVRPWPCPSAATEGWTRPWVVTLPPELGAAATHERGAAAIAES